MSSKWLTWSSCESSWATRQDSVSETKQMDEQPNLNKKSLKLKGSSVCVIWRKLITETSRKGMSHTLLLSPVYGFVFIMVHTVCRSVCVQSHQRGYLEGVDSLVVGPHLAPHWRGSLFLCSPVFPSTLLMSFWGCALRSIGITDALSRLAYVGSWVQTLVLMLSQPVLLDTESSPPRFVGELFCFLLPLLCFFTWEVVCCATSFFYLIISASPWRVRQDFPGFTSSHESYLEVIMSLCR